MEKYSKQKVVALKEIYNFVVNNFFLFKIIYDTEIMLHD